MSTTPDTNHHISRDATDSAQARNGACSRREFLRSTAIAGATIAITGGLGGILVACGEETTATTTPASTPAMVAGTSTSTSVSAQPENAREIKLGFVSALTGSLASFGITDKYCVDRWNEAVKDGLVCGDGKKHPLTIVMKDSQSDSNRSAQVTADLILNDRVDLVLCASTPDLTIPSADQCEANGMPSIFTDTPWDVWFDNRKGDPTTGFEWTYLFFWGQVGKLTIMDVYLDMWKKLPTNNVIGLLLANDPNGLSGAALWPGLFGSHGFKVVDPGRFQVGNEDFTAIISKFKKEAVDIVAGVVIPPDFVNFTAQSAQQSFFPTISTGGKAMLFPQTAEAIGPVGYGVTAEQWWSPVFPYKSSLTGETCQQLADDYETRTGNQWSQPLEHYALFEVAADVLKRTTDIESKQSIVGALKTTKMSETVCGPLDWTARNETVNPVPNCTLTPILGGQWVKGEKYPFEILIVDNLGRPEIPVQAEMKPMSAFKKG